MTEKIGNQAYNYEEENAWTALGGRLPEPEAESNPASCSDRHPDAVARRSRQQSSESIDDHCTTSPLSLDEIKAASRGMSKVKQIRQDIRDGLRNPDTGELEIIDEARKAEREGRLF